MNYDALPELSPQLKSLAADFAYLTPAGGTLNRDELLYRAGWAACASSSDSANLQTPDHAGAVSQNPSKSGHDRWLTWLWPLSTAGLFILSATLAIALATREVRVVYIERTEKAATLDADLKQPADRQTISSPDELVAANGRPSTSAMTANRAQIGAGPRYFALRQRVLAFGVDELQSRSAASSPIDYPATSDSRYGALLGQLRGG